MANLPELTFYPAFDQEIVTVAIQHWKTREILMIGTMNREALAKTLEEKMVYLYQLSQHRLWLKGERSGIRMHVKDIRVNCNTTNLLILVEYESNICHTGAATCFYRRAVRQGEEWVWENIAE